LSLTPAADGYTVDVTLPAGAYATSLLREILKTGVDAAGIE
jgi:tRNA pseudouridine13 synthase